MIDAQLITFIRREIAQQLTIINNGTAQDSGTDTESIASPFPGMDPMLDRPKVEPYGFHSRAPDGTLAVNARVGDHPAARIVLGHRDANRPAIETGESSVYSVAGYEVRVGLTKISIRKGDVEFTQVVGEPLATLLSAMLADIASHTHHVTVSVPGVQSGGSTVSGNGTSDPPGNAAAFTALKTQVDGGSILAKDGGAF